MDNKETYSEESLKEMEDLNLYDVVDWELLRKVIYRDVLSGYSYDPLDAVLSMAMLEKEDLIKFFEVYAQFSEGWYKLTNFLENVGLQD